MKNQIQAFLSRFFKTVEATNCSPHPEEMIENQAFIYKTYPLTQTMNCVPGNTLTCTVRDKDFEQTVHEEIGKTCVIDTIAIFRAKEAFGMTDVIGGAFGKRRD
jgi:hypothetical protein